MEKLRRQIRRLRAVNSSESFNLQCADVEQACHSSVLLIYPILICMLIVISIYLNIIYINQLAKNLNGNAQDVDFNSKSYESIKWHELLLVVFFFIFFIAFASFLLFILFKYKFYRVIFYWLCTSTLALLGYIFANIVGQLFARLNISLDYLTIICLTYNNAFIGMLSIFNANQMPKILNQFYLIFISSMVAIKFLYFFPGFICYAVLFAGKYCNLKIN